MPQSTQNSHMASSLPASATVLGLDGCRGGWLVARLHAGELSVDLWPDLAALADLPVANRVLIDMPIGLETTGPRACDAQARALLGPKRSSVFSPPCAAALHAPNYPTANALNRQHTGKGLSKQAWHLVPKIKHVASFMEQHPLLAASVLEAHPELCFAAMNGGAPLMSSKRTPEGQAERQTLLLEVLPGSAAALEEALGRWPRRHVQPDDILDATALAWAATQRLQRLGAPAAPAIWWPET